MVLRISSSSIPFRREFSLARKNVDETLEDWYDRLKHLAQECDYGSDSETFILNQFVVGLDVVILDYLNAQTGRELSVFDVFELVKCYERSNEAEDVVSAY